MNTILITGAAGFIGANLVISLLQNNKDINIIGIDNLNDYYDVSIKKYRLDQIEKNKNNNWTFIKGNIADKNLILKTFEKYHPDIVINLAAQAGVRYSIENPDVYIESNIIGFYNILEACRNYPVKHLIFASSSSVYGSNQKIPYSIDDKTDSPVSLYAATKKSDELLAHAYAKLYNIPTTGLRFFTVYGPAGRPDMAYFSFTEKLIKKEKIQVFNYGNCKRDFTYIDDIVKGIILVINKPPKEKNNKDTSASVPYKVYNLGNSNPENLLNFINILSEELIKAKVLPKDFDVQKYQELVPMQPGDVEITYADTKAFEEDFNFKPSTSLKKGLSIFAKWYKEFYKEKNK